MNEVNLEILYQDSDVLVLNKPENMIVHSSLDKSRINLLDIVKKKFPENEVTLLHRLDKDTTGTILFSLNPKVNSILENQIHLKECEKYYLALVKGQWNIEEVIKDFLKKEKQNGIEKMVKVHSGGQVAISSVKTLKNFSDETLLEFRIHTGRMHQIRVQSALRSHPLVGDELYGAKDPRGFYLHAFKLSFHLNGRKIAVTAPLPEKFKKLGYKFEAQ